jgi:CubicO group peptidase (beta-lactamase class C family)
MTETVNLISEVDSLRLSKQYYFYNGKWELMDSEYPPIARGNGGTISTAWDFAKFFQMLVYKGQYNNQRILKEETISEATSPLLEVTEAYLSEEVERELGLPSSEWYELRDPRDLGIDKHRGYGFVVSENGAFSHGGIYGTFAYADPNYDLVVIIFTQSIYGGNPGNKFIETIYDSIIE